MGIRMKTNMYIYIYIYIYIYTYVFISNTCKGYGGRIFKKHRRSVVCSYLPSSESIMQSSVACMRPRDVHAWGQSCMHPKIKARDGCINAEQEDISIVYKKTTYVRLSCSCSKWCISSCSTERHVSHPLHSNIDAGMGWARPGTHQIAWACFTQHGSSWIHAWLHVVGWTNDMKALVYIILPNYNPTVNLRRSTFTNTISGGKHVHNLFSELEMFPA
jgi:hypothetical protein